MNSPIRFVLLSAALLLTSCAHQAGAENKPREPAGQRGEALRHLCFSRSLSGFRVIDDERLLVRRGRQQYELEMIGSCPELRFAQHLGVSSFGSCLSRGDRILAYPYGTSRQDWRPPSCLIGAIYRWLPEDTQTDTLEETP